MTTLREVLTFCWWLLRKWDRVHTVQRVPVDFQPLINVVSSKWLKPVEDAVAKVNADISWRKKDDHEPKRKEALEWAVTYAREHYGLRGTIPAWELRFLLEYAIGKSKGLL